MTPTLIDRLLSLADPLHRLRCDLEALGIDPAALALAVGADPAPVSLMDAGPCPDCAFHRGVGVELADKLRAAERALDNLRDALASNQGILDNQRRRVSRLAQIARRLREDRDRRAHNADGFRDERDRFAGDVLRLTNERDGLRQLSESQDADLERLREEVARLTAELARKPTVVGEGDELINTTRAAVLADCPGSTVSRAAKLGDLAAVDGGPGRGNLYRVADVLAWARGRAEGFECAGRQGCPNRTVRAGTLCSGCRGAISRGAVLRPVAPPPTVAPIARAVEAPTPTPPPPPPATPAPVGANRDAALEAGRWSWEREWAKDARGFWLIQEASGRFRAARVGSDLAPGETKVALIVRNRAGAWDERPYQRNGHLAAPRELPPSVMARPTIRVREDGSDVYEVAP